MYSMLFSTASLRAERKMIAVAAGPVLPFTINASSLASRTDNSPTGWPISTADAAREASDTTKKSTRARNIVTEGAGMKTLSG